ncbi:MAG: 5'/3'-nucleotidase SurE [Chloroflexi bacterium]|nr:5'/3'-nucleotidase SurE [Chloroflexota bacterium]
MKILVTNDDGAYAKGLWALVEELIQVGEVTVIAPDREQSGVGTSVTLHRPVRATRIDPLIEGIKAYAVEGTPADCVILGLETLMETQPQLVVSGINEGANLGNDVLISGTVGGALQGYFHNIPSLAISVAALENVHFEAAAKVGRLLARLLANRAWPKGILLNVNLPNLPSEEIQGVVMTRLCGPSYAEKVEEGHDGRRKYYWIVRGRANFRATKGTDIWALRNKQISITPLHSYITDRATKSILTGLEPEVMASLRPVRELSPVGVNRGDVS